MSDDAEVAPAGESSEVLLRYLSNVLAKDVLSLPAETDIKAESSSSVQEEEQSYDLEKQKSELDKRRIEINKSQAELDDLRQDIKLRKRFAWAGYWMSIGWLIAILHIIISDGLHLWSFSLSDSVLLALIGTTTANVLGVLYIVMRYLFDKKGKR